MSDLGGSNRISGGPAAILGAGGAPAQVSNPPPRMQQLAVGHSLKGIVVSSDTPGQIRVRTEQGTLSLRTARTPPPGTRVTLQIRHIGAELSVLVFPDRQADSTRLQPGSTMTQTAQSSAFPLPATPVQQEDSLSLGHFYSGVVESRSALHQSSQLLPESGTALLVRILRLNAGQDLDEVVRSLPQEFTSAKQLVKGQLMEQSSNGQSSVRTEGGLLRINQLPHLPSGTLLLLALFARSGMIASSGPEAISFNSWPALSILLQRNTGKDAHHTGLPHPGPELAGRMARFLAGLDRGASSPGWLSNLFRLLPEESQEASELSERLGRDAEWLRQLSGKSDAEGWRYFLVPLLEEQQITYLHLHLRQRKDGKAEAEEAAQPVRFVVDIAFETLGPLQLDGLLGHSSFDVILRSRIPLGAQLQESLSEVLSAAGTLTGLEGRLSFQTGTDWTPLPPPGEVLRDEASA